MGMKSGVEAGQTLAMSVESEQAMVAATSRIVEGLLVQKKLSMARELCGVWSGRRSAHEEGQHRAR